MSPASKVSVQITRRFSESSEQVFDAFLNPIQAARFLFATPAGKMVRAETDPRVGGKYVFVDQRDGVEVEHSGEYLELERPARLAFSFRVPKYSRNEDRVSIELAPLESGCGLTLTHEMSSELEGMQEKAKEGWGRILDGLARTLTEGSAIELETVEVQGAPFAWVWFNDPRGINAMGFRFVEDFERALSLVRANPALRGVIFAARGKNISVGLNFKDITRSEHIAEIASRVTRAFDQVARLPMPTLILLKGLSVGGPIELGACCDFRIASEDARISAPAVRVGFFNPAGLAHRLARLIGLARAKDLLMSARMIDAATAERWGWVSAVVPNDGLFAAGTEWAANIASLNRQGLMSTKRLLDAAFDLDGDAFRMQEAAELESCLSRPEPLELITGFLRK